MLHQKKGIAKDINLRVPGLKEAYSTAACPGVFCLSSWHLWEYGDTVLDTGAVLSRSGCSYVLVSGDLPIVAGPLGGGTVRCSGGAGRRRTFCVNEKIGNVNFP